MKHVCYLSCRHCNTLVENLLISVVNYEIKLLPYVNRNMNVLFNAILNFVLY